MSSAPGERSRFERLPAWQRGVILCVTTLVIGVVVLLAAEAAVRIRNEIKYGGTFWGVDQTYKKDPATGLRMPIPNSRFGAIVINSFGFRSPAITIAKPVGRLRIAFLGGSTTYCAEVSSNRMTWPALVIAALRRHWPTLDVDYINAGVPGYTTRDSWRRLRLQLAQFTPDIIVIYQSTNDLEANAYALAHRQGLAARHQEQNIGWLGRHSLLVYLVEKNLEVMSLQREATAATGKIRLDMPRLDAEFRRDYASLVATSQHIAKIVVTVTFAPRLRPSQSPEKLEAGAATALYYMPYMTIADLLAGYEQYNQVIREVAAAAGTVLVGDEDAIPADARHYTDSVHFTDAGSMAMAHRVALAMIASPRVQALVEKDIAATGQNALPSDMVRDHHAKHG
ncbi:MAG: SGNH/GDSL hydrolase family protein [Stellaceae bacterium]